jgi:protein SCO1/2
MPRSSSLFVIAALAGEAIANPGEQRPVDVVMPAPPTYEAGGVTVDERLGAQLPLDAAFRAVGHGMQGVAVTLGELVPASDPTPVIITFNYSDCPQLCSLQLNGLTASMPQVGELSVGAQYRILTISLNPNETVEKLTRMRDRYLERLPAADRERASRGWTFVMAATPGDTTAIARVADTVGFRYKYIADRAEWAHPSAYVFTSNTGKVVRYVYGFEIEPATLRESVVRAGLAEPTSAAGFLHVCYFFDPDSKDHSRAGMLALRIGAASFIALFAGLGTMLLIRRNRRSS